MSSNRTSGSIALALLSMAVAIGASELYLRTVDPQPTSELRGLHEARPDRPWVYGLRPGARGTLSISGEILYEVNAEGFRDRIYARPKPAGTFRILVLGDSLSFGYGVAAEDVYSSLMEQMLGDRVEVLNFGVGGYNPYNEAALLADVGVAYEPDLVLVQFCTNDLTDPTVHFDAQTRLHLGTIPDAAFPDPGERGASTPGWMLSALSACRGLRVCALVDDAMIPWTAPTPGEAKTRAALRSPDAIPPGPTRGWLGDRYGEMAKLAERLGAAFAVVAFPFRAQIEGRASHELQRQLAELGQEGGWETIDLLPAFVAAEDEDEGPLFIDLWHLSAAGHSVAARAIVVDLGRRNLVPGPNRG